MVWVGKPVAVCAQLLEFSTPAAVSGLFLHSSSCIPCFQPHFIGECFVSAGLHQTRGLQLDWDVPTYLRITSGLAAARSCNMWQVLKGFCKKGLSLSRRILKPLRFE